MFVPDDWLAVTHRYLMMILAVGDRRTPKTNLRIDVAIIISGCWRWFEAGGFGRKTLSLS
jgi:hypothetical protein